MSFLAINLTVAQTGNPKVGNLKTWATSLLPHRAPFNVPHS